VKQRPGPQPKKEGKKTWQERFLEALGLCANVRRACLVANVARSAAYAHRAENTAFAAQWDSVLDDAVDWLEEEVWTRAKDGTERPVYQGGAMVGTVREYSDTLAVLLLKAHRPEKYRENVQVQHAAGNGLKELVGMIRAGH
jgi:hypothetical protein